MRKRSKYYFTIVAAAALLASVIWTESSGTAPIAVSPLRSELPGVWRYEDTIISASNKDIFAINVKEFMFHPFDPQNNESAVRFVESRNGRSGEFLTEDWEFRSYGTYDVRGDTIKLLVNRFHAVRVNFERGRMEPNSSVTWEKVTGRTYDSIITDGSQDRWILIGDLRDEFKQIKRYRKDL